MSARDELFTYLTAHPFATDAEVSRDTGLTVLQIKRWRVDATSSPAPAPNPVTTLAGVTVSDEPVFLGDPSPAGCIATPPAFVPWAAGRTMADDIIAALNAEVTEEAADEAVIQAVVGGITGLDGSGFSGLPLVGSLAQALGGPTNLDVATLGALGQFFAVAVGGGTIVPWAVIPAAAITGTDPVEIARRNLWPAMAGFVGVIIVAIFLL